MLLGFLWIPVANDASQDATGVVIPHMNNLAAEPVYDLPETNPCAVAAAVSGTRGKIGGGDGSRLDSYGLSSPFAYIRVLIVAQPGLRGKAYTQNPPRRLVVEAIKYASGSSHHFLFHSGLSILWFYDIQRFSKGFVLFFCSKEHG